MIRDAPARSSLKDNISNRLNDRILFSLSSEKSLEEGFACCADLFDVGEDEGEGVVQLIERYDWR